ncbi:hypothetical protein [Membranihabitans marinus]|uniref:hypothetical protein n=1 Tax=Membranihabitans marinus TaxID=1227546 RepID=UPI001F43D56F|nr:hypothetical protein [Membranihabitans marinus]
MSKKNKINKRPESHEELKGFDIQIDEFGQVITNISQDKLNSFLDKNVIDKKMDADQVSKRLAEDESE